MIGKVSVPRGLRCEPLIRYLYDRGRRNEHDDPHIIAAWRPDHQVIEPRLRPSGRRDFRTLTALLRAPHEALPHGYRRPVWHCSVRAAPGDLPLTDGEWAGIAQDIMHRTGLHRAGEDDRAVRWIAVRHADDHIHLVAMLARQDGSKPTLKGDWYQVGAACQAAEYRFGLAVTAPRDGTAARRPTRAEEEKTVRHGRTEPARVTLRRQVALACTAGTEAGFFGQLRDAGVLVRYRYSPADPGQVTGYAVGLPDDTGRDGRPVWYGGGRLAPDLTLPRLRQSWQDGPEAAGWAEPAPGREWAAAAAAADLAREVIAAAGPGDPAADDAIQAAAGLWHAAARAGGGSVMRMAADAYDRAARQPGGRIPPPGPARRPLRQAAAALSRLAAATGNPVVRQAAFAARMAAFAEQAGQHRAAQQRAAQQEKALYAAALLMATRKHPLAAQASPPGAAAAVRQARRPAPAVARPGRTA